MTVLIVNIIQVKCIVSSLNAKGTLMSNENATLQTRDKSEDRSKAHPWRVCPVGYHYVRTHKVHTKPGKVKLILHNRI